MERIKITFSLIIALLIVTANGCNDMLDENLYSSIPVNGFYGTQNEAQLALNGVYGAFWFINKSELPFFMTDVPGGILTTYPSPNQYDDFAWTISARYIQDTWDRTYTAINRANTLLDNLENSNISDESKDKISGQAKFLRALSYFNLVRYYGGVPLYIQGTSDLSNIAKPRSSADEVYQQIIKDLQEAAQELSPYSESDHSAGKATSAAAQALLAKVYAQDKDWSNAASTAKAVIDMGVFGLVEDYNNVLSLAFNNGKEDIFSIQHTSGGDGSNNLGNNYTFQFGPPTITIEGGRTVEFFKFPSKTLWWKVNQSFFDQTPDTYRKWQTMRNKMPYYYEVGSSDQVQDTVALDSPYIVKYINLNNDGSLKTGVNISIIRYSNILLIYAEALNEANGGPTPAAYSAINEVRARARGVGTPNEQPESVYPPLSGLNQSEFRDSVLVESAREFVGEGHRRGILLRHGMFISKAINRGINASDKHKLYPIPAEEINRNANLEQNPGY